MAVLTHPSIDWSSPSVMPQAPAELVAIADVEPGMGAVFTVNIYPVQGNAAVDLNELTVGYPT